LRSLSIYQTLYVGIDAACDRRKAPDEPYINQLLEVATLVGEATDGKDANFVIAALLHDAIED
jgi:(p)ppGpp synthase/HD superfamily hydrolase